MSKPLLIFDGDCGFCRKWIAYWQTLTEGAVDYAPYQEVGARFPRIPVERFEGAVQLVEPDGTVRDGARAVFGALATRRRFGWMLWLYEKVPGIAAVTEAAYGLVARNRVFFSRLTYHLWGKSPAPARYALTRRVYLRLLGFVYLIAFASFWGQAQGLVGSKGILPSPGYAASLNGLCAGGVVASLLLISGRLSAAGAIAAWILYGKVFFAGQEFLGFQWDSLMMEMGFFSIFLTFRASGPSFLSVFLLRWLLFRVVFYSGYVKLASGDPSWRDLTALTYHFETQPLPTWIGWWFHQLPVRALKACAALMFAFELIVPFLYFLPRRPRALAFFLTVFLQLLIDATGNYGFFGWQVVALSVLLLDDSFFERFRWFRPLPVALERSGRLGEARAWMDRGLTSAAAILVVLTTVFPVQRVLAWVAPLNVIHRYGVFAVMTTHRGELIFEGSQDGQTWLPYELKWKPGDLGRRPAFCEPHMPRLDWLLWFAALGPLEQNLWVGALASRILENSAPVMALFERNPFPDAPPRTVRASFYLYHFTDLETRVRTGHWWTREARGLYLPAVELRRP